MGGNIAKMVRMNVTVHIPQKNQVLRSQQPQKSKNVTDLFALLTGIYGGANHHIIKANVFHPNRGVTVNVIAIMMKMNQVVPMKNAVHSFAPVGDILIAI